MARAERWIRTKGDEGLNLPIGCLPRRSLREIPGNDYLQHHIDITTMRAEFKRDCKPRPRPTEGQGFFLIQATAIGCIFLHFRVAKTYHLNVGLGTAKPAEQRAGLLSVSSRLIPSTHGSSGTTTTQGCHHLGQSGNSGLLLRAAMEAVTPCSVAPLSWWKTSAWHRRRGSTLD